MLLLAPFGRSAAKTTYYLIIISINCYYYVDELLFNLTITKLTYFNKFVIYYIDPFQCI